MRTTATLGLKVWNDPSDQFNTNDLAANWDAIDAYASSPVPSASSVQKGTTLPGGLVSGDAGTIFFLTAAASGFAANTLLEWNGTQWNVVGPRETLAAVPVSGNYAGRMVLLSAASGGFTQWSLIFYDGTTWQKVGGSVELASSVPGTGNFAGRMVLLTSASGGFEAYSLIAYNGTSWNRTEKRGIEMGTLLPATPYIGQVFELTTAGSGFNAYDIVRYNGSSWARIGPPPVTLAPGYEWDYKQITSDVSIPGSLSEGTAVSVIVGNSVSFDGSRVRVEFVSPLVSPGGGGTGIRLVFLRDSTVLGIFQHPLANSVAAVMFDTPSAGTHSYSITAWADTSNAGGVSAGPGGSGTRLPAFLRVTKA
jgi:hypothetical protein